MAMMAYGVVGRGMLSAEVPRLEDMAADDIRKRLPRFQDDNIEKNLRLRSALEAIAARKNATLAQLAIAWPLAQGERAGVTIVPIPGAKSRKHLEENVRAAELQLSENDLKEIGRLGGTRRRRRDPLSRRSDAPTERVTDRTGVFNPWSRLWRQKRRPARQCSRYLLLRNLCASCRPDRAPDLLRRRRHLHIGRADTAPARR